MNFRRMMGVAALGAAASSLVLAPGAGAQDGGATPESHAASASGTALELSAFGQGLTVSHADAGLDSTPRASASGAGLATPVFEAGATTATVEGSGTDGSAEPTCEGVVDQIPGLGIELACSSSVAEIADGLPRATATGGVSDIVLNPLEPLLETPLAEVVGPAQDGVNQLLDALAPVTGPLDEATGLGVDDTLRDLFGAVFEGADLVTISIGDTSADVRSSDTDVTAACASEGARIDVLDAPAIGGVDAPPVLSVIVGEAAATVVADRASAEATPEVNPSLVTVRSALLPGGEVQVAVGQSVEVPLPEPLGTSVISVADGTSGTTDDGATFATANAVSIDLLNGEALMGGVELSLASCTASAGVVAAQAPPPTAAPDAPEPRLPTTGSDGPNPLVLASTVGLAGLGLALVRRSRYTD